MKPQKAIEILKEHHEIILVYKNPDLKAAVELGIEALRRHIAQQCCQVNVIVGPLPGESKE